MDKITRNIKAMFIPMIISISLLFWYRLTDNAFEKLLIIFILATVIIPLFLGILNILLCNAVYNPNSKSKNKSRSVNNSTLKSNSLKTKAYTKSSSTRAPVTKGKVNPSRLYPRLRNLIIKSIQNQMLDRNDVLELKNQIDNLLGDHKKVYDGFTFENDLHEIYIKIKSKSLKDSDYRTLIKFVNKAVLKAEESQNN